MADLFDEAAGRRLETAAPLAQRLRPAALDGFVGQEHVVGPGPRAPARDRGRPGAVVRPLRPAGSGKTTLARIVAGHHGRGVRGALGGVGDGRERARGARAARERLGAQGRRTMLFLDEIHRFNKAQQDALLPGVEEGS